MENRLMCSHLLFVMYIYIIYYLLFMHLDIRKIAVYVYSLSDEKVKLLKVSFKDEFTTSSA